MIKIKKCNVPRSYEAETRGRGPGSASGGSGGDGKPTRIRNVLNENQLHTLRACYAVNPRPDATMKEQLEKMTSLSPRVIRVWFQNKRCKDKKKTLQMKLQIQQKMLSYDPRNMYRPPPPSPQRMIQDTLAARENADGYITYLESDDSPPISP